MSKNEYLLPRLIRLRDIPLYLGMDRNRFNKEVRPYVTEIPIGKQGKAFDRLDLDQWVDYYKSCSGRPCNTRVELWGVKKHQGFRNVGASGISTKKFLDAEFAKAVALIRSKKQKNS